MQPPGFQGASSVYDMLVRKPRITSKVNLLVVKPGQPYFHEQIRQAGIYCGGLDDGALKSNGGNG